MTTPVAIKTANIKYKRKPVDAKTISWDNSNVTIIYDSSANRYGNSAEAYLSIMNGSSDESENAPILLSAENVTAIWYRGNSNGIVGISTPIGGSGKLRVVISQIFADTGSVVAKSIITGTMSATINVVRSTRRYTFELVCTPTQIAYNMTTGEKSAESFKIKLFANKADGTRAQVPFGSFGVLQWRKIDGENWTNYYNQNTDEATIAPSFSNKGIDVRFINANDGAVEDMKTLPISKVSDGGDSYTVMAGATSISLMLQSLDHGEPIGDVINTIALAKNGVALGSGVSYNVPSSSDGDENTLSDTTTTATNCEKNGWIFNYSLSEGRLTSTLVKVLEKSPTSVQIPIDVFYKDGDKDVARQALISYSVIMKGPAGRSYKPNVAVLYDETGKTSYTWDDKKRDFIYYPFTEKKVVSYHMYGVKEYGTTIQVPPTKKDGDDNWEYVSEYKTIITNCIFGTNAIIGGFLMTNRTATASNGECGLVLDGNEGSITSVGENSKTVLVGGLMTIFNNLNGTWRKNIEFGIKNGYAVMSYYDNNGNLLYDLGPSGLTGSSLEESKFEEIKIKKTGIIWESARLNQQGQWNTGTGTIYNKIDDRYDSLIFGGGAGTIPYDRIGSTFTSVSIYRYTAARINGTAVKEPSLGLSTAAMAEKADGMYFTSKTTLGNSSGSLVNLASGIYGVTSDRRVNSSLVSLADEYVPKYQVLFNSFLNGKQSTIKVSSKSVVKVSSGADGMVPIN